MCWKPRRGGESCLFKHQSESRARVIVNADCAAHAFLVEAGKGLGKRSKSLSCRQHDNSLMQETLFAPRSVVGSAQHRGERWVRTQLITSFTVKSHLFYLCNESEKRIMSIYLCSESARTLRSMKMSLTCTEHSHPFNKYSALRITSPQLKHVSLLALSVRRACAV